MFHSISNFFNRNSLEIGLVAISSVFLILLIMIIISAGEDN